MSGAMGDAARSARPRGVPSHAHGVERVSGERDLAVLIHRSAAADEAAFADLYDATAARVYGLAARILGSAELAQQATREVYVEIWRTAPEYSLDRGSPMAWITAIAHRRLLQRLRSASSKAPPNDSPASPRRRPAGRPQRPRSAGVRAAETALGRLDQQQRDALELAYFDGHRPDRPESLTPILSTLTAASSAPSPPGG